MKLIFNLAITLLVIGALWYVVMRIIDIAFCHDYLDDGFYWPPVIIIVCSTLALIVLGLIALWR